VSTSLTELLIERVKKKRKYLRINPATVDTLVLSSDNDTESEGAAPLISQIQKLKSVTVLAFTVCPPNETLEVASGYKVEFLST
jgi:hypothetical protein